MFTANKSDSMCYRPLNELLQQASVCDWTKFVVLP